MRSESLHLTPGFWFLTAALPVDTQKLAEKVTVLQALQKPFGVERASRAVCADCQLFTPQVPDEQPRHTHIKRVSYPSADTRQLAHNMAAIKRRAGRVVGMGVGEGRWGEVWEEGGRAEDAISCSHFLRPPTPPLLRLKTGR